MSKTLSPSATASAQVGGVQGAEELLLVLEPAFGEAVEAERVAGLAASPDRRERVVLYVAVDVEAP